MDTENNVDIKDLMTREDMLTKVQEGTKTAVRRQKRLADVGDTFELRESTYEITNVYEQQLQDVTEQNAGEEGFADLDAYKESITSIHKNAVWMPKLTVWVHEFKQENK